MFSFGSFHKCCSYVRFIRYVISAQTNHQLRYKAPTIMDEMVGTFRWNKDNKAFCNIKWNLGIIDLYRSMANNVFVSKVLAANGFYHPHRSHSVGSGMGGRASHLKQDSLQAPCRRYFLGQCFQKIARKKWPGSFIPVFPRIGNDRKLSTVVPGQNYN